MHVGRVNGQYVLNPDEEQRKISDMSLYVAGTKDAIMMVEAGAKEVSEDAMMDAILYGHDFIKQLVNSRRRSPLKSASPRANSP